MLVLCYISPVLADDDNGGKFPEGYGNGYHINLPEVTPSFNQFNDYYMSNWVNKQTSQLDLWEIYMSVQKPFTNILGQFFYLILYGLAIYSIWSRSNNIALVTIVMGLTLGMWYLLFPIDSWWVAVVVFALGVAAILFRLFKRR